MPLPEFMSEIAGSILADFATKAVKHVLSRKDLEYPAGLLPSGEVTDISEELLHLGEEPSESIRFILHQRHRLRVDLAKARWDWLLIATYFHPTLGSQAQDPSWNPRLIGGQFTVADFATGSPRHQRMTGENAATQLRLVLLHSQIGIAELVAKLLMQLDAQVDSVVLDVPVLPWDVPELSVPWKALWFEVAGKTFPTLPNFNSYCGFKSLWSVVDTPASGIYVRDRRSSANLFAYAALMELTWWLVQRVPAFADAYNGRLSKHGAAHQYALRRTATQVIKTIYQLQQGQLHAPRKQMSIADVAHDRDHLDHGV